jgi:hypothetical protein
MGLLILAEGASAFFAWKTAAVPDDVNDSSPVFFAICIHIQAWAVGVPILAVLGDSSPDATYLGRVLLIWVFSVASMAFVVYPKVARAIYMRRNQHLFQKKSRRVVVSGLSTLLAESSTTKSSVVLSQKE